MAISKKSWLGVANEAGTPGTFHTPTLYVPCKSMVKAMKKREYMQEERGDRNEYYDGLDTTRWADWDIKGPWYNDTHTYFALGAIGSVASAQQGGTSAYKHTLTLADVPKSLSLAKSFDNASQVYKCPYSVVEKFSLKFSGADKLLECDASGKALFPVVYTTPPTPAYSTLKPFAGWMPTLTFGASSAGVNDIIDFELHFEQKITLWSPANGTQDWITAYYGPRKVTLGFTARFDNDTLYQNYFRASTNGAPSYDTLTFDLLGPVIASTYYQELNIVLPNFTYDSMEHDLGKDNVLIKAKATAVAINVSGGNDSSLNNMIKMFVQNTVVSYAV